MQVSSLPMRSSEVAPMVKSASVGGGMAPMCSSPNRFCSPCWHWSLSRSAGLSNWFLIKSNDPDHCRCVTPYTAREVQRPRHLYPRRLCWLSLTNGYVRSGSEVQRIRSQVCRIPKAGEYVNDHLFPVGSKRTGPGFCTGLEASMLIAGTTATCMSW